MTRRSSHFRLLKPFLGPGPMVKPWWAGLLLFVITLSLLMVWHPWHAHAHSSPAPHPPTSNQVRFAVIGDFGSGSAYEKAVAEEIMRWRPDFIITAGDNRYGRTTYDQVIGQFFCDYLADAGQGAYCDGGAFADQAYLPLILSESAVRWRSAALRWLSLWLQCKSWGNSASATYNQGAFGRNAFFPTLGNHDYSDGQGIQEYLAYFTLPGRDLENTSGNERYYDFVWGPIHFFMLNSNYQEPDGNTQTSVQATWLQSRLARSTSSWNIVVFHHPPFSSSSGHGSNPWMQWPFEAWGADAVIGGHDHTYERLQIGGIPYFVNGLGGQSRYGFAEPLPESVVRYNRDFGAMVVDADVDSITFRFVTRTGKVIDAYSLQAQTPTPAHTSEETTLLGKDMCRQLPDIIQRSHQLPFAIKPRFVLY